MNFTSISELSKEEVNKIIEIADKVKNTHKSPLSEKTFVLFFPESSIRTRLSFEKGINNLGGQVILFPPSTLDKREEIIDVQKYIENWASCIIVRHSDYNKILELTKNSKIPIINAMTSYNHPCEILSDIYSISKIRKDYTTLSYTFVGENGNIANSWVNIAKILNLKFNHVSTKENRIQTNSENYFFTTELEEVLPSSDIVLTDPLSKNSRNEEYYRKYQITLPRMNQCKKNAILNPCPPFFRGEEVSADVIDSEYFVGYEFKENLLNVQQAIILYSLKINII